MSTKLRLVRSTMIGGLVLQDLVKILNATDNILICAHTQPDGDAVGSSLAMAYILESLHKNFTIYNESGFPTWLSFLERPCDIITDIDLLPFEPELIIALDSGDTKRLGDSMSAYIKTKKSVNIDHHLGNPHYGSEANLVDPTKSATGEMIADLAQAFNIKLHTALSEALYVAISSDTGNFTFGNTKISTLEWLVKLVATPIDIASIRVKMDNNWSFKKLKFWGQLYQEIQIVDEGRFGYVKIPFHYYEKFEVTKEDLEGFIDQIRRIQGVRVAMILREDRKKDQNIVKISMRSHGADNVQVILAELGGGGHKNAAGATVDDSMDVVLNKILLRVKAMW